MQFRLPPVLAIDESRNGNIIQQLIAPGCVLAANLANYQSREFKGRIIVAADGGEEILVIEKSLRLPNNFSKVIHARLNGTGEADTDLSSAKWLRHPKLTDGSKKEELDHSARLANVLSSWEGAFSYLQEDQPRNIKGLRPPQRGAVHAVHHHWTVSDEAATIVMPTGTGKTETMLSVMISTPCPKVLVVVPTDALRTQVAGKFLTLGILKDEDCRVLLTQALYPVVGVMKRIPKDVAEVDYLFGRCHVVITTSQIAGQCLGPVQERMASHCSFLFIDEAHHIAAPTWAAFRNKFAARKILQFTATPFREDDKPVDGKIIFKYPLKKAQEEGYFKPIRFKPVVEFDPAKADRAIAERAVAQLREDAAYNHILMARVGSVDRARQVFAIYAQYEKFNPVQIHTGIKSIKEREQIRRKILGGESKIVVCVDMLGEGFDLPELKIAAFHDIRKSLAVTLQLAGRFTRVRSDLGEATFIANIADVNVRDELRKLYTRDPDWNLLLPELSDEIIQDQVDLREFTEGFANFPDDIPLRNIRPATSTVIYKTKCQSWTPDNFRKGVSGIGACERVIHDINHQKNTLIAVTARKVPIEWAAVKDIFNWDWELFIIFWDQEQNLLFIHGSSNNGDYRSLAKAVAGEDVELLNEQVVFRCFAGVNRMRLQNVGLTERLGRLVRYTGRMGADVEAALTEAQKQNTSRSVLFGTGYENGCKVTVGASRKGRIWSFATTNVHGLTRWCGAVGRKILDATIDPDEVLKGTLESELVATRPNKMPVGIDWPEQVYHEPQTAYSFVFDDGTEWQLLHTDICLAEPAEDGDIKFVLSSGTERVQLKLVLFEKNGLKDYRFQRGGSGKLWVKHRATLAQVEDFFDEHPPVIWFVDGSSLEGNKFTPLKKKYLPYDRQKIQAWDWTGVDLRKESQGITKRSDSIQFRVIEELKKCEYDVVYDDDDTGEAADLVTIRVSGEGDSKKIIDVEFYHCKFSKAKPGERIKDLYEVCGQAQKSIHWMESHDKQVELFTHLLRRQFRRKGGMETNRFEHGNSEDLIVIREMSRVCPIQLKIFIVQPGLSKQSATVDQLELLSVTENHLMETYNLPLVVIASP